MTQAEKYDVIETGDRTQRAQQVRLQREVTIHHITAPNPAHVARVVDTVSRIARLDHPGIPHLIDFLKETEGYQLVTEAFESHAFMYPTELTSTLVLAEQLANAVSHAHQRGIAHGELTTDVIRCDAQQYPKLTGLGLRQCRHPQTEETDELFARDFVQLRTLLHEIMQGVPADEAESERDRLDAFNEMLATHSSATAFHAAFQPWLKRELMMMEAEKLAVNAGSVEQSETSIAWAGFLQSRTAQMIAAVAAGLLLIGLSILLWPRGKSDRISSTPRSDPFAEKNVRGPDAETDPTGSDLNSVGVFNNPEAIAEPEPAGVAPSPEPRPDEIVVAAPEPKTSEPAAGISNEPSPEIEPVSTAPSEMEPEEVPSEPVPTTKRPIRKTNPFTDVPVAIDLPERASTETAPLAITDLTDREPLVVELRGGVGAHRAATFSLASGPDANRWLVLMNDQSGESPIANLKREGERLLFAWASAAARKKGGRTSRQLFSGASQQ